MITGLISIIVLIAVLPPAISNGEWGTVAVAALFALFMLALGASARAEGRAYNNMIRFWYKGELPGEHRRTGKRRPQPERPISIRELRKAEKKREAYKQERMQQAQQARQWSANPGQAQQRMTGTSGPAAVCHYCGRFVSVTGSRMVQTPEGPMREYRCPKCGLVNYTKLGG